MFGGELQDAIIRNHQSQPPNEELIEGGKLRPGNFMARLTLCIFVLGFYLFVTPSVSIEAK